MTAGASAPPLLASLQVADEPEAWAAAGFTVEDATVRLEAVTIELVGRSDDRRGIVGWTLTGVDLPGGSLDGLPTAIAPSAPQPISQPTHANGATKLDHVVVLTPDLDRTIAACESAGLDLRRIRDTTSYGSPMRQAFFRLGPTILEVVSGDTGTGQPADDAPASWFGLAVDVADLDQVAVLLGDLLGTIKGAVQEGRRIATLRHKDLGMSVAVAAMDDHGDR